MRYKNLFQMFNGVATTECDRNLCIVLYMTEIEMSCFLLIQNGLKDESAKTKKN